MTNAKYLIVIVGPTAVGKTEASIALAERLDGEIISADSRLLYRGMDIGTAKPTKYEQICVPHHLIDVAEPNQIWSLAKFQRAAYHAVDSIHTRGKLPFLVGGTGQYVLAVIEGWQIPEVKPDPRLRNVLNNWGAEVGSAGLYERLTAIDPDAASRIEPQNLRRIIRALEVIFSSGAPFSNQRRRYSTPYQILHLGLTQPRPELYARIDERIQRMIDEGFENEVRALLEKGYSPDLPPLSAIGYRQMIAYIQGEISLDKAIMLMKRFTRQFVRKQSNWFKLSDPRITWFRVGPNIIDEMIDVIQDFRNS
jgi:tRNA dimethylallyltransferase